MATWSYQTVVNAFKLENMHINYDILQGLSAVNSLQLSNITTPIYLH